MSKPPGFRLSGYNVRIESPGVQIYLPVEYIPSLFEVLRQGLRICYEASQSQGDAFPEEVLHECGAYHPTINADMSKRN